MCVCVCVGAGADGGSSAGRALSRQEEAVQGDRYAAVASSRARPPARRPSPPPGRRHRPAIPRRRLRLGQSDARTPPLESSQQVSIVVRQKGRITAANPLLHLQSLYFTVGWLGSRVVSVLDSGAEGPGSDRSRDAVG